MKYIRKLVIIITLFSILFISLKINEYKNNFYYVNMHLIIVLDFSSHFIFKQSICILASDIITKNASISLGFCNV